MTDNTNMVRERRAERTQKKQKAWILITIRPTNTRLNTAMTSEIVNKPHQVRRDKSALFSDKPGSKGTTAMTRTARYAIKPAKERGILNPFP